MYFENLHFSLTLCVLLTFVTGDDFEYSTVSPDCSDYGNLSPDHPMCKPLENNCSTVVWNGVTPSERLAILAVHNKNRQKIARGLFGNEQASDMRELVWNPNLAIGAQAWADQCPSGPDCPDCRKLPGVTYDVGQNIYMSQSAFPTGEWVVAIKSFFEVPAEFSWDAVENYQNDINANRFTQVIWGATHEIGCGANYHSCSNSETPLICKTYVCNYGPSGNVEGQQIYKIGKAASSCSQWSRRYRGLCA